MTRNCFLFPSLTAFCLLTVGTFVHGGCNKDKPAATVPSNLLDDGDGQAKKTQGKAAAPARKPSAAAEPADTTSPDVPAYPAEVRAPEADDLEHYIKDLGEGDLYATIKTSKGAIRCLLHGDKAPMAVANFVGLARGMKPYRDPASGKVSRKPYYNGIIFHRVIPGFMIQGGDPLGRGTGGPGYKFDLEVDSSLSHVRGALSMANAGPNTNGSQFYVMDRTQTRLDGSYTVFGQCENHDVVRAIAKVKTSGDKPLSPITIEEITFERSR